jgi:hypothetical protein
VSEHMVGPPMPVRPAWRRWVTEDELTAMSQIRNYHDDDTGEWTGANLGVVLSGCRVREHTPRSRRRDARWARRRGYTVDERGIVVSA